MKKLLVSLLCAALVLMWTCAAYADSNPLSLSKDTVEEGDTELTVTVYLNDEVSDGVFSFHYDASDLKLIRVASPDPDASEINGPAVEGTSEGANLEEGQVKTAFVFNETGKVGDKVLVLTFEMSGRIEDGQTTVSVSDITLENDGVALKSEDTQLVIRTSSDTAEPGTTQGENESDAGETPSGENPSSGADSGSSAAEKGSGSNTGDHTPVLFWSMAALSAAGLMCGILVRRKRIQ